MEPITAWGMAVVQTVEHELVLVAAVGILLLGIEDLLFDAMWLARGRQQPAASRRSLDRPARPGLLAVFVPAWDEGRVLPATLRHMLGRWRGEDVRIYVGCYPNDSTTLFAVSRLVATHPALRLVIGDSDGPTSKADNLNRMWQALREDERAAGQACLGVVLHDAEDLVQAEELALYRQHLGDAAMVQIPVEPLLTRRTAAVTAHYADEFAEAHAKELPLRSALSAALPAAGVGCAFSRAALMMLAQERPDGPFSADSLTEDYEAGLILGARGLRCRFVTAYARDGRRIATRSAFPATLEAAVRQKGRWISGIAFAGWDRLDWAGARAGHRQPAIAKGLGTRLLVAWMLWRDRRAAVSALVILAAYAALVVAAVDVAADRLGWWPGQPVAPGLRTLLVLNALLLCWRLAMRAAFVASIYGWQQGLAAIPRAIVGNIIHMLAARRAFFHYMRQITRRELVWDKTDHGSEAAANGAARAAAR